MMEADLDDRDTYIKVLRIIHLLKNFIKSYSEALLCKVSKILEISLLLDHFLSLVRRKEISLNGLVQGDTEIDQKFISYAVDKFSCLFSSVKSA